MMPADMNEIAADLSRIKDWSARHDAACTERNKARERFENSTSERLNDIEDKVNGIMVKFGILCAIAGGAGSGGVQLALKFFGG